VTSVTVEILDLIWSRLSRDLEEYWSRDQLNHGQILADRQSWGFVELKDCRDRDHRREER
jgi:hypothetical protein